MRTIQTTVRLMSILFLLSSVTSARTIQAANDSLQQKVACECCQNCEGCECCKDGACSGCTEGQCNTGCCANCECCSGTCGLPKEPVAALNAEMNLDASAYLGCAVDAQQCAWRASNQGFANYKAEKSYLCPNAAKYACWGE